MKTELQYYDIFPKVVLKNKETIVTIKSLGKHTNFENGDVYKIYPLPMNEVYANFKVDSPFIEATASSTKISFSFSFKKEQQYNIVLFDKNDKVVVDLRMYCLEDDLYELIPLKGDLHVHSFRSDGKESPEIVAANYRKAGFDFMTITDHEMMYPSYEAIECYKEAEIDLLIVPGEEVHTPNNEVHIVNFGGSISVNEFFQKNSEKYYEEVKEVEKDLEKIDGVDSYQLASSIWAFNKIKENGGLAIFPHPNWVYEYCYHIPEKLKLALFELGAFDAFELIGGQSLNENTMQINLYNELCAKGISVPIVGSSDSHGTINSEWFQIGKTVVLAKENSKDEIISAIKGYKAAALEQYASNGEIRPRVYGPFRIASYVEFLINEYFPLHDELCFEEGRLMKDYVNCVENSKEELKMLKGRTNKLINKYFGKNII
ncbi:MAG: PHP domain-containing protein [Lachnospirales bacterium]